MNISIIKQSMTIGVAYLAQKKVSKTDKKKEVEKTWQWRNMLQATYFTLKQCYEKKAYLADF